MKRSWWIGKSTSFAGFALASSDSNW